MIGHIRERKLAGGKRRWQARYPHPRPRPGGNRDLTATYDTKREALDWLAATHVKYKQDPGHNPDRAKQPFAALVEQWQTMRFGGLAPKSRARYEQVLREHLMPEFGGAKVGDVTREWVRDFLGGLSNQTKTRKAADGTITETPRYAPGTVLKVRTTLSSIMAEAVTRGIVTANPCHNIAGLPSAEPRKMLCLSPAEVATLAEAIDPAYRTLIYVAAYTGLRAGELHELRWRDVDLLRGRITVARALKAWQQGQPIVGATKTGKTRGVELAPDMVALLTAHRSSSAPGGAGEDALVFTNGNGTAVHQVAWLRNYFKPATLASLPRYAPPNAQTLRFHDLRHTYVSMLIQQDVHPKAIQEQAGHASITTTMDRYGHLLPGANDAVKAALTRAFAAGQEGGTVTPLPTSNVVELHG